MASFRLTSLDQTEHFGQIMAQLISSMSIDAICLFGALGSGKTTLTRAIVLALLGGENAEVSSPTFTLCNHYPTAPEILHCDLYRCTSGFPPDELLDAFERPNVLSIIEWPELLPEELMPAERLDIHINACESNRLLHLEAHGVHSCDFVQHLEKICRDQHLFQDVHNS